MLECGAKVVRSLIIDWYLWILILYFVIVSCCYLLFIFGYINYSLNHCFSLSTILFTLIDVKGQSSQVS
jgi:hypothetical protein